MTPFRIWISFVVAIVIAIVAVAYLKHVSQVKCHTEAECAAGARP